MRVHLRRALLGLTTSAVLVGGTLVSPPAQAATDHVDLAAEFLPRLLEDGIVHTYLDGQSFPEYGATLDVYLALHTLGRDPGSQDRILGAVESQAPAYIGAGEERYAGATAKLLVAGNVAGRDLTTFAGGGLVPRLAGLVHLERDHQRGRVKDDSQYGDYSNTLTQAWSVRAFAATDHRYLRTATRFLLRQQCTAGFFRESVNGGHFRCSDSARRNRTPSVDATALSVLALREARRSGVTGLRDDIRDAVRWLRHHQHRNGSFTGNGVRNANSTGLAASALAATGWRGAAGTAAVWLAHLQVPDGLVGPLAGRQGAVAYTRAALRQARAEGILPEGYAEWTLATAQAAPALTAWLPRKRLRLLAPARAGRGSTVVVRARRLAAGERFTVKVAGRRVHAGWASKAGRARLRVQLPQRRGPVKVKVVGARKVRVGTTVVRGR